MAVQIESIRWDNVYLILSLKKEDFVEVFLEERKRKLKIPLEMSQDKIVINITNINVEPGKRMLDTGIYELTAEKEGKAVSVVLSSELCEKLSEFSTWDRIFPYDHENYAYLVKVAPIEYEENIGVSIKVWYMLKNIRPNKERLFTFENSWRKKLKKSLIEICVRIFEIEYKILSKLYGGKNHVLLMSETRPSLSGNLLALDRRARDRGVNWKIEHSFCSVLELSTFKTGLYWLRLVPKIARQNVIVVDDYCPFFKYVKLSHKVKLIQVWHAGVGFKSVGYSRFGKDDSPLPLASCHRRYDYVVVGAEGLIPVYQEVFGLEKEKIIPLGLARLDDYKDEMETSRFREEFFRQNPSWKGKEIILFAPTYRGTGQITAFYPYKYLNFDKIYELCNDTKIFLMKMHPYIRIRPDIPEGYRDRIVDMSEQDMNQLIQVCDILITDYSSVIYEFALQKKPMIFFAFDKDKYRLLRGFHWDYDKYAPGTICRSFDEVLETLRFRKFNMDKVEKFIKMGYQYQDKNSSDRLIEFISGIIEKK